VASPTNAVPDADRISPPMAAVGYRVSVDLLFQLGDRVMVESPSHAIVTSKEPAGTRVRFAAGAEALDRDVVLLARSVDASPLCTVVTHRTGEGEGYAAITVVPDLFSATRRASATDATFVIDVSGSMSGTSIVQAKAALRLCLRQLREGDRFNVIAFSSNHDSFAPQPVRFSQATLEAVDAWVLALDASGGTDMLEPLRIAATSGSTIVVLLTDGQVGNEAEIVENVLERAAPNGVRFYTFGIGTNVSEVLLRELARRSGGATELIHPGERIDDKVVAQFARATAPRVRGLSMKLQGVDLGELAPAELPAFSDGEPWVLFGRYAQPGRGTLELRGTVDDAPFFLAIPLELPARSEQPTVAKLWARERVRDLERAVLSGRRADAMRERIVSLAVEHGIASSYTSFVVIEKRSGDRRTSGLPETRVVPVGAPAGWAMFPRRWIHDEVGHDLGGGGHHGAQDDERAPVRQVSSACARCAAPAAGRGHDAADAPVAAGGSKLAVPGGEGQGGGGTVPRREGRRGHGSRRRGRREPAAAAARHGAVGRRDR
jgi:Ca-activated chloride channel family protein